MRITTIIRCLMVFGAIALNLSTTQLKIANDGKSLCTEQLQQAIDKISKKGGVN